MSTSSDGGATWGAPKPTANNGLGGQPVVQPNGTVVVPYEGNATISAFTSTTGGLTWGAPVVVASVVGHTEGGNLRSGPLPSAEVDGSGKVFVAWQDCRFESGCSANDIVFSISSNGVTWSAVKRIPMSPPRAPLRTWS
jgi:outer membrane protein assembly factor BamB